MKVYKVTYLKYYGDKPSSLDTTHETVINANSPEDAYEAITSGRCGVQGNELLEIEEVK